MTKNFRVVVADDDFMIAKVHSKIVNSQDAFEVVGISYNYEQTLSLIHTLQPDLLILDVYMPDGYGTELLREIRSNNIPCDVVLITAAKEQGIVEEAFRLGIFDYLIKPFDLNHLVKSLEKYIQYKAKLANFSDINQTIINDLKNLRSYEIQEQEAEKGIDYRTLENIKQALKGSDDYNTVENISRLAGVSRSTARSYLNYLCEQKVVEVKLKYGTVGRPQSLYRLI